MVKLYSFLFLFKNKLLFSLDFHLPTVHFVRKFPFMRICIGLMIVIFFIHNDETRWEFVYLAYLQTILIKFIVMPRVANIYKIYVTLLNFSFFFFVFFFRSLSLFDCTRILEWKSVFCFSFLFFCFFFFHLDSAMECSNGINHVNFISGLLISCKCIKWNVLLPNGKLWMPFHVACLPFNFTWTK